MTDSLRTLLTGPRYVGYTYSYPHKTAYRPLTSPRALKTLWDKEDRSSLFLYAHVPFCEMRCGFCNLFTQVGANTDRVDAYLQQLHAQARQVHETLGGATFSRVAFGGGTPTLLSPPQLEQLFGAVQAIAGPYEHVQIGIETSPRTTTPERLEVLRRWGVDRVSIGVQSFFDAELKAMGRPSSEAQARDALDLLRRFEFPVLNIDLIYGASNQTVESFLASLEHALSYAPEEIYLYPLYVRALTGLARRGTAARDGREALYDAARDRLLDAGYDQVSLRMFQRRDTEDTESPRYSCQDDGMVGLGCGARSYTRQLHYSDDWAVGSPSVRGIIDDWIARDPASFTDAHYGIELDVQEQRRRFVIQSVAVREGLSLSEYRVRFGTDALSDVPQLADLVEHELLQRHADVLIPTARGLAWADAIGPWLYTEHIRSRMEGFALR